MTLTADAADAGKRLDSFVHERLPKYSRSRLQAWIKDNLVQVNGASARASYALRGSESIELQPAELILLKAEAEDIVGATLRLTRLSFSIPVIQAARRSRHLNVRFGN